MKDEFPEGFEPTDEFKAMIKRHLSHLDANDRIRRILIVLTAQALVGMCKSEGVPVTKETVAALRLCAFQFNYMLELIADKNTTIGELNEALNGGKIVEKSLTELDFILKDQR